MAKSVVILMLIVVLLCGTAAAQHRGLGMGVILGEPTGLSFKKWSEGTTAIDGAIAWSFGHKGMLHVHADYLVHDFSLFDVEQGKLPVYYGIGGRIKLREEDSNVGVRVPVGINYIFAKAPFDAFFEIVPLLNLTPSTEFDLNGGIGVRFFWGR